MTKLTTADVYRGFGTKRQTDRATAVAWASAAPYLAIHKDDPINIEPGDVDTDVDEYTGSTHIQRRTVLNWKKEFTHVQRLRPHEAILFMALLFGRGNLATAQQQGVAYRTTITPLDEVELDTITMWQASNLTGNEVIPGIGCKKLDVEGDPKGFFSLSGTLAVAGSIATGVDISGGSHPTGESYFVWGDGDVLIDDVSIKTMVKQARLSIAPDIEDEYQLGGAGTAADAAIVRNLKKEDLGVLALDMEPADATELDYIVDETEVSAELRMTGAVIEGAYSYMLSWKFNAARVLEGSIGKDGQIQTTGLSFLAHGDGTNPIITFYGQNQIAEYLGAVA